MRAGFFSKALFLGVLIAPFWAQGTDHIKTYSVPKEPKSEISAPVGKPMTWTPPANWKEEPASTMRLGQFAVPGPNGTKAELAITAFPGNLGSELMNVNRWRRELGLDPVAESGVISTTITVSGHVGKLYDFSGPQGSTSVAWVERNGTSYFFKMRGENAAVASAKPALIEFLKSIHFRE